jgi:hypothetical protein
MSTYQKIAALVFRLASIGLVLYSCLGAISTALMMPRAVWIMLPTLTAGIILYFVALPLARLATRGFDK